MLAECHFCAHHCGANRLRGHLGLCQAGAEARLFSAQVEVSDELELIPVFAIALSGCDLHCHFCITGQYSWNANAGEKFSITDLARKAEAALASGARTIMILGGEPTIHLPTVLEIVAALPPDAKLIWKTNDYGTAQSRALLDGIFDVWLADYKFGNDECAWRLSHAVNYTAVVQENLLWAAQHSELIIRHLLMPGHVDCCWRPVAEWLASLHPAVKVNLRSGFWPKWSGDSLSPLRLVSAEETCRAQEIAWRHNLRLIT